MPQARSFCPRFAPPGTRSLRAPSPFAPFPLLPSLWHPRDPLSPPPPHNLGAPSSSQHAFTPWVPLFWGFHAALWGPHPGPLPCSMGAARTRPPLHLPRALQHPWVAPWGGRRTLWAMPSHPRGLYPTCPPAAPLSSAPLAAAGAERSCQPQACQAALAFCSPWTLLARGHCLAWQAQGGHEHEANAPAGSILPASPCPAGVLSAARAKRGHPWRAPSRWEQRGRRFPGLGFTVKETGASCRAAISTFLVANCFKMCWNRVGWRPRGTFRVAAL